MPTLDWIHVAMFIAGLVLQYLANRGIALPSLPQPAPQAAPTPSADSKPLLDLVHKLLDQRQPSAPQLDPLTLDALMGLLHKLLDQPKPTAGAK